MGTKQLGVIGEKIYIRVVRCPPKSLGKLTIPRESSTIGLRVRLKWPGHADPEGPTVHRVKCRKNSITQSWYPEFIQFTSGNTKISSFARKRPGRGRKLPSLVNSWRVSKTRISLFFIVERNGSVFDE